MADPYQVLGVSRTATEAEIKRAYRRLAKQYHPDLAPGDRAQADRFRSISDAYETLRDPKRRAHFDLHGAGESARPGSAGFGSWARAWRGAGRPGGSGSEPLAEFFTMRPEARPAGEPERGPDTRASVSLDFAFAIQGGNRTVELPNGKKIDVRIPPGTRDGQVLRLRGQGERSARGMRLGDPGDALIEVRVAPHPEFRLDGNDIHVDLTVTLAEAVLGGRATVPTVDGPVTVTIPAASNGRKPLRLKGRGAPFGQGSRGDQYVFLRIVLPEEPDPELDAFVRRWAKADLHDAQRRTAGR